MAASALLTAATVATHANSAVQTLTLTAPVSGVHLTLDNSATTGAVASVILLAAVSIDGTNFSSMQRIGEAQPGEKRDVYHDAKNAAKVQYAVYNRDATTAATVSLLAIQV